MPPYSGQIQKALVDAGDGGGDVVGPNSSTIGRLAAFAGATGKLLEEQMDPVVTTLTAATSVTSPAFIAGNGGGFKPDTTTAHTAKISAYDVDGAAYADFVTLTNGNTPTCLVSQPAGGKLAFIPPTADPHVVGALWNNAGTLAISAG